MPNGVGLIPRSLWNLPTLEEDLQSLTSGQPGGVSVSEDDKNVYIDAAMPGIDPENIEINYDKGMVWISGSSIQEEQSKRKKYYSTTASSYSYRIPVPGDIDLNGEPEASCDNGMVTIIFPKSAAAQPKKISLKAKKKKEHEETKK